MYSRGFWESFQVIAGIIFKKSHPEGWLFLFL